MGCTRRGGARLQEGNAVSVRNLHGKTVLVTGAASGIGRATALALARAEARLILCDKNEPDLRSAESEINNASQCLLASAVDVSDREAVQEFARRVHETVPAVDVLVNSAGVYLSGTALDLSLDDWEWSLGCNLWGLICARARLPRAYMTHFFVPRMVERGIQGHIVNLVSMYGYWVSPNVIGYLTPKFATFGFSEALREDLRRHSSRGSLARAKIGVSTVCPGIIRTGIVKNMRIRNAPGKEELVRASLEQAYRRRDYGPERVASAIVRAIRKNKGLVLVSPESWLMYYVDRFFPIVSRFVARRAADRLFRPRDDAKQ